MRYMLLIYSNEAEAATATPEDLQAVMNEYWAFNEAIDKRGANLGGEALHETSKATTVRIRDGKDLITDGPFAETKEQLGGYYLISAKDLDEAIEIAKLCPGSRRGSVEIRPVVEFG